MNIFSSLFRMSERRRTYTSLMNLDDHLLRDIGLNRSDIRKMSADTRTAHTRGHRTHE